MASQAARDDSPRGDSSEPSEGDLPRGNLFTAPKLTALDPADKAERRNVERLLEALDQHG